jgi:hypothetical protein
MQALSFSRRALIPSFPAAAWKGDHAAQQRGGRGVGPEAMRAVECRHHSDVTAVATPDILAVWAGAS